MGKAKENQEFTCEQCRAYGTWDFAQYKGAELCFRKVMFESGGRPEWLHEAQKDCQYIGKYLWDMPKA